MNQKRYLLLYLVSALCLLVFAMGILLFYPSSLLLLNQNSEVLYNISSAMFWVGLLSGIVLQFIIRLKLRKAVRAGKNGRTEKRGLGHLLFRTNLSILLLAAAVVGVAGTIVSLIASVYSSWHLFVFIFVAVLGISEYLIFNSKYFVYFMKRSEESV